MPSPQVFTTGKGCFEERAVFLECWLTSSPLSEEGKPAETAMYQLCSGTYNHTPQLVTRAQENLLTANTRMVASVKACSLAAGAGGEHSHSSGGEGSAGKQTGLTTPACENSPEDIGVMFRAQPQPLSSFLARPGTAFACHISPPEKQNDIIFFLPSLPVFSDCLGGLSSCPPHAQDRWGHCWNGKLQFITASML